jgi:hypothetical protein
MTTKETTGENDGSSYVKRSRDGSLVLRLSELAWETEFFGRRFGRLEIEGEGIHDLEATAIDQALKDTLSFGDENGFDVIEAQLDISWLHQMYLFESNGFRLVDTKVRFLALITRERIGDLPVPEGPEGEIGFASADMKEEILSVTHSAFTNNPSFKSRFNNERFFTKSDMQRYYTASIEKCLGDPYALFAVAMDEGKVAGYTAYTKTGEHKGKPLYKAAWAAVAPEYRGRRIYFTTASFVQRHLPESGAYLEMTTQLSNLTTLRNLIKAQRNLDNIQLIFYRAREDGLGANPA